MPSLGISAIVGAGKLAFELDKCLSEAEPSYEPYAHHRIFHDKVIVRAFFEAEEAHRRKPMSCGAHKG
uniref:Uncharacterized protein n=1 Tax=Oryza brachyantha TaxID=4533 RepID=J3LWD0_ORYBR